MADLSKIKLNGTEYDLKDAVAREKIQIIPMTYKETIVLNENTEYEYDYDLYTATKTYKEISNYLLENKLVILQIDNHSFFYFDYWHPRYNYLFYFRQFYSGVDSSYFTPYAPAGTSISDLQDSGLIWKLCSDGNALPTIEPVSNVETMLTSFGLNANANLTSAIAGTAEVGKAVVQ